MNAIVPRDSDLLVSTHQVESLNVSRHFSSLLESNAWEEFMHAISDWTDRKKSNDNTFIFKVPVTVPDIVHILNNCGVYGELNECECKENKEDEHSPCDEVVEYVHNHKVCEYSKPLYNKQLTVSVAIKLQRVLRESTEDADVCKEIEFLRKGKKCVHEGGCVHFPLIMAHIIYKDIHGYNWYMIINRWMDGDLGSLFESDSKLLLCSYSDAGDKSLTSPYSTISHTVKNAVVQTLMGMYTMNNIWNIFHNDLHPKNVLYIRLGKPVTFVYDLQDTMDSTFVYRITLIKSDIFCLIWDFAKSSHESELCSNDFYDFFSQASDIHPRLTRHVRDVVNYSPSEMLDVSSWIFCLIKHWSDGKHLCIEKIAKSDITLVKLPHPCVYSCMYNNK